MSMDVQLLGQKLEQQAWVDLATLLFPYRLLDRVVGLE